MALRKQANVLRHRDFRLLFWGQTASNFGSNAVAVAMAIYITRTTGSATDLGLILAAQTVPFVVLLLFGGVWADRLPRHRVMIVSDLFRAGVHGLLAVLILDGHRPGVGDRRDRGGVRRRMGVLPAGGDRADAADGAGGRDPGRAGADGGVLEPVAGARAAVATALVLTVGAGEAFVADALSFVVSALTLAPMRPRFRGGDATVKRETLFHELRAGFREVSSRPWVWVTISAFSVTLMCSYATWMALGPEVTRDVYGQVGLYGVFVALYGTGCVAGSLLATVWRSARPLRDTLLLAVLWPAMSIVLAIGLPRGITGAWMVLAGLQNGLFMVTWETALAHHIPPSVLSRVSSYDWMGSLALLPVGFVLAGPLASLLGARVVLGAGGALGVLRDTRHAAAEVHPRADQRAPGSGSAPAPVSGPAPPGLGSAEG